MRTIRLCSPYVLVCDLFQSGTYSPLESNLFLHLLWKVHLVRSKTNSHIGYLHFRFSTESIKICLTAKYIKDYHNVNK